MKQTKLKNEEFVKNREFPEQIVGNGYRLYAIGNSPRIWSTHLYQEPGGSPSAAFISLPNFSELFAGLLFGHIWRV